MARATDQQVQTFVNERIRRRCEQVVSLLIAIQDDKAAIDDVYEALSTNPTWSDTRTDGPPHLMTPSDVLAVNTFYDDMLSAITSNAQLPIVRKAVVRTLE